MHPSLPPSCRRRPLAALAIALCAGLILSACAFPLTPEPPSEATPGPSGAEGAAPAAGLSDGAGVATPGASLGQPSAIGGTLSYTNDNFVSYATRHAVALVDLHGFVLRDPSWKIPADALMFGSLSLDRKKRTGRYRLRLPMQPTGSFVDVDHNGALDGRVQVFVVAAWEDPLTESDERHHGWPANLASTVNDPERHDEISGGKLVIWTPDAHQQFPTGFGPDGRLFTDDDPIGPVPAGYSVIDLDKQPFALDRGERPDVPLHEQADVSVKDLSNETYSAAFSKLFEQVRREYAFNGIPGKAPDWDALYSSIAPRIAAAEQQRDARAFFVALHDFVLAFHDGHVYVDGGDIERAAFDAAFGGGYGFAVRELDDGRFVVAYVLEDGPAAQAGMRAGAELTAFDGRPVREAAADVRPWNGPFSTDLALHQAQLRYLPRAAVGAKTRVTFANPGRPPATATLAAVDEMDSLHATSPSSGADQTALPIEYRVLESGLGYVRINTNDDDIDLIDELFARALDSFEYHETPGIIVDLRRNDGGTPLYLASYLSKQSIPLAQLEYFSDASRRFEPDGDRDQIEPVDNPYRFEKLAVLVDQGCFSACELEAYGFSKLPGAIVVGQYPTAGVEAEVSRGQYWLPEDIFFQAPTGRYVLPDGDLFLEGAGVAPTLRVPVDQHGVLADKDVVLKAAEEALLKK
jgi:C-terminal processing protease CtpA/Prc